MSSHAIHVQLLKLVCSVGCLQVMMPSPSLRRDLHRLWTAITHQVCSLFLFALFPNLPCTLFLFPRSCLSLPLSLSLSLSLSRFLTLSLSCARALSLARSLARSLRLELTLSRSRARAHSLSQFQSNNLTHTE